MDYTIGQGKSVLPVCQVFRDSAAHLCPRESQFLEILHFPELNLSRRSEAPFDVCD